MLVRIKGQEETVLPPTPSDGLEGTYVVKNLGTMERATEDTEEDNEEEVGREQIYPEGETY